MKAEEICRCFRLAADQEAQIRILAEMNDCRPEDIRELLRLNGIDTGRDYTGAKLADSVKKMHGEGRNDSEISKLLNVPLYKIHYMRRDVLKLPSAVAKANVTSEAVMKLWAQGKNDAEIANKLRCGRTTVRYYRQKLGLEARYKRNVHA